MIPALNAIASFLLGVIVAAGVIYHWFVLTLNHQQTRSSLLSSFSNRFPHEYSQHCKLCEALIARKDVQ